MMASLFSVFDPCASFYLSWVGLVYFFTISFPVYFFINPYAELSNSAHTQIGPSLSLYSQYLVWVTPLLGVLAVLNLSGLLPYTFTVSAHMCFTLCLALILWGAPLLFKSFSELSTLLAHLVPLGSPVLLAPFMVLVESVSLAIRPITLSVRLMANMVAGHLLLSLSGSLCGSLSILGSLGVLAQVLMMSLELAVAFIQAYVLVILISLYAAEYRVPSPC